MPENDSGEKQGSGKRRIRTGRRRSGGGLFDRLRRRIKSFLRGHGLQLSSGGPASHPIGEAPAVYRFPLRRIGIYVAAGIAVAIIVFAIFYAYSRVASPPASSSSRQFATFQDAMNAARSRDAGALSAIYEEAPDDLKKRTSMKFLTGYLLAAEDASQKAVTERFSGTDRFIVLAGYYQWHGKMNRAIQAAQKAVESKPDSRAIRLAYISLLFDAGKPEKVLAEADVLQDIAGEIPVLMLIRGRAHIMAGRLQLARKQLTTALSYPSAEFEARNGLAFLSRRTGDSRTALRHLRTMLTLRGDDRKAITEKAVVLENLGRLKQAEKIYRQLLRKHPDNYHALNNLAYLLAEKMDRPREGLKFAKKAAELQPEHPWVLDTLGWTHHLMGNSAKASRYLRKAVEHSRGLERTAAYRAVRDHWRQVNSAAPSR